MFNYTATRKKMVLPPWYELLDDKNGPLLRTLVDETSKVGPETILTDMKYNSLFNPFEMKWCFGFDVSVPLLNLTTYERKLIFYSALNIGILFDYCSRKMTHLRGHKNKIVSVSSDKTGRWIATGDNGASDRAIMIWDTTTNAIVRTLFDYPPQGNDLLLIGLSPSAKLLVTITNQSTNSIAFWLWTYGKEEPDDIYKDERNWGTAKSIHFHPNQEEYFMVVFEKAILFFCWSYEKKKILGVNWPKSPVHGQYTDGTYISQCHEVFVSSSKGCILVFGLSIFASTFVHDEMNNDKFYVKTIKTSKTSINCLTCCDELLVSGDSSGTIMIFDKRIKLLYWISRRITNPIKSISFAVNPRKYKFVDLSEYKEIPNDKITDCYIDRSTEYETLILEKTPKDATIESNHFVMRDFFLTTQDGTIYVINVTKDELKPIFPTADGTVVAIDVHDEMPYLLVAYATGRLVLYNYSTFKEVMTAILPESEDAEITCVKYSPQGLHLACGKTNGELWLLHPATLGQIYVEPFRCGVDKVVKIVFSIDSFRMAYYDSNMTVYAFYYDCDSEDWIFNGKVRSHYKDITNILFLHEEPFGLYTIGKDRHIIKYTEISPNKDEIDILTRDRIEQKDMPVYFTSYPKRKFSKSGYFLIVDDKHKYKTISMKTCMCTGVYLGPAYGCFKGTPVVKMEFLPKAYQKYIIFMTKKQIGIQLMPIDGNPFKYVGCFAHTEELLDFQISNCGKYVFTTGTNDRTVFMWKVNTPCVSTLHMLGGLELQPFYCLLEGGRSGYMFQEMRDLFYYMQILQQGEQISVPRTVTDTINLGEIPDLMRACGYYPSEYEIENLLTDLRYQEFDEWGTLKDKVTFCEFVKLFINHKPAYGYSINDLEESFNTITSFADEFGGTEMPRQDFVESITTTGEQVSGEQLYRCLCTLLHEPIIEEQSGERDFSYLPDTIDFDVFTEDMLGLDTNTLQYGKDDNGDDDDDGGDYYGYFSRR